MKTSTRATPPAPTVDTLHTEIEALRRRLQEAEETLEAIRGGEVDALVVEEATGHRIYTLEGADRPYRLFVEQMQQGAATLHADGTIAWCNPRLAELLKTSKENLLGAALIQFIAPASLASYENLLGQGRTHSGRGEAQLRRCDTGSIPVFLTFNALPRDCGAAVGVLITDLTTQRHHEQLTAAHFALRESQRQMALVNDTAPVYIAHCDTRMRYKLVNARYARRFGLRPEECVGRSISEVGGDAAFQALRRYIDIVLAGQPVEFEIELPYETIGRHVMHGSYAPELDAEGKVVGFVAALSEISDRKKAEEAHARLAAIIDSSEEAIISKTLEGNITSWNAAAERLLGYAPDEIIGKPVTTLIPADRQNEEAEILECLRRDQKVEHFETVRMTKDGRAIDVSLTISPIRDGSGRVIGGSKIMRDISGRKRAEEALRVAQQRLQEYAMELEARVVERTADLRASNEQLEAFVYSIAHDLRAPLRWMEGFSSILLEEAEDSLSDSGRDFARRINQSAQFMAAQLEDLLAFSRLSQQRIPLTPVDLEAVAQAVRSRLENEILATRATVEMTGPWPAVLGHEPTLCQVLYNLLSNALKFVRPGIPPLVRVGTEAAGRLIRVWVEDNGIGVMPEHQDQVFRLFLRLHRDKFPGTGVGLAIVQKGVERMGGRVGIDSIPGQGSRFWFELDRG